MATKVALYQGQILLIPAFLKSHLRQDGRWGVSPNHEGLQSHDDVVGHDEFKTRDAAANVNAVDVEQVDQNARVNDDDACQRRPSIR